MRSCTSPFSSKAVNARSGVLSNGEGGKRHRQRRDGPPQLQHQDLSQLGDFGLPALGRQRAQIDMRPAIWARSEIGLPKLTQA